MSTQTVQPTQLAQQRPNIAFDNFKPLTITQELTKGKTPAAQHFENLVQFVIEEDNERSSSVNSFSSSNTIDFTSM